MNEFHIYEMLLIISHIATQYSAGEQFGMKVRQIANRMAARQYRVAVIGEFKRGKSSLIKSYCWEHEYCLQNYSSDDSGYYPS